MQSSSYPFEFCLLVWTGRVCQTVISQAAHTLTLGKQTYKTCTFFQLKKLKDSFNLRQSLLPLQLSKAHVHNLVHLHRIEIVLTEKNVAYI